MANQNWRSARTALHWMAAALLLMAALPGCSGGGPETGYVEGTVSLDGEPLEHAMVSFQPQGGRRSIGMTDENGHYELRFSANVDGALLGDHQVIITTKRDASGGEGGVPFVPAQDELLPAKYHEATELKATVEPGSNQIDFDLTSA